MWWVEFDTNQTLPQQAIGAPAIVHAAQASFMSAAIPAPGDFYYFYSHLFETGIWVVHAEKGHDGKAEKRHGKLLPWKVQFFKGITVMAEGIDGNCRRCRRVISGLYLNGYSMHAFTDNLIKVALTSFLSLGS